MIRFVKHIVLIVVTTMAVQSNTFGQELSPIEEITDFLKGKVWVNNITCYGDSCMKNRYYDTYYYWDGAISDYVRDSILFYSFALRSVAYTIDSITEQKKPFINNSLPLIVVLSKDELEFPTYNCLYKSESFSGFVELKMNKNVFVLKGLFNDDDTIVTIQYKKTTPPPRIKEILSGNKEK